MTIRVAKDETFVEVGFSVSCGAAAGRQNGYRKRGRAVDRRDAR